MPALAHCWVTYWSAPAGWDMAYQYGLVVITYDVTWPAGDGKMPESHGWQVFHDAAHCGNGVSIPKTLCHALALRLLTLGGRPLQGRNAELREEVRWHEQQRLLSEFDGAAVPVASAPGALSAPPCEASHRRAVRNASTHGSAAKYAFSDAAVAPPGAMGGCHGGGHGVSEAFSDDAAVAPADAVREGHSGGYNARMAPGTFAAAQAPAAAAGRSTDRYSSGNSLESDAAAFQGVSSAAWAAPPPSQAQMPVQAHPQQDAEQSGWQPLQPQWANIAPSGGRAAGSAVDGGPETIQASAGPGEGRGAVDAVLEKLEAQRAARGGQCGYPDPNWSDPQTLAAPLHPGSSAPPSHSRLPGQGPVEGFPGANSANSPEAAAPQSQSTGGQTYWASANSYQGGSLAAGSAHGSRAACLQGDEAFSEGGMRWPVGEEQGLLGSEEPNGCGALPGASAGELNSGSLEGADSAGADPFWAHAEWQESQGRVRGQDARGGPMAGERLPLQPQDPRLTEDIESQDGPGAPCGSAAGERRTAAQWDPALTLTLAPPPVPRFDRRCAQAGGAWPAAAGVGADWELPDLKTGAPKGERFAEAAEAALRGPSAAQARRRGLECVCTSANRSGCR